MTTPYFSIDIETTGLNPDTCQILEIGVVHEDWWTPINELDTFNCHTKTKQLQQNIGYVEDNWRNC